MFQKIPRNAFNSESIKATFYCDLALLYQRINRKIKQNNLIFSFLLKFKLKRYRNDHGKSKERKIKNQNKQTEKMNQRNESNIRAFNLKQLQEINGNSFIAARQGGL